MEDLLKPFISEYFRKFEDMKVTYIQNEAARKSQMLGTTLDEELESVTKELNALGTPMLWFSEGTSPAAKQQRSVLLRIPFGSLNWIVDEVLSMPYADDLFQSFIKQYDVGSDKAKLIKHTKESQRVLDDVNGRVPANMLLFGTGSLLHDPTIMSALTSQLESGLARRAFYAYSAIPMTKQTTALERYENLTNTSSGALLKSFQTHIVGMANNSWHNTVMTMNKPTHLFLLNYQIYCEERAALLENNILSIEMQHRYMKVARLAGIYAMWDGVKEVTTVHLSAAIKVTENSGLELRNAIKSVPLHIKLAEHVAKKGEVTMSQLVADLPWFGSKTKQVKSELLQLAQEYGHTHNIIISVYTRRGIEYIKGVTLAATNTDEIVLSMGDHQAYNYQNGYASWDKLGKLITKQGIHWVTHHLKDGHREEGNVLEGFNLVVVDVDNKPSSASNVSIQQAQALLGDYKYLLYETKSSTPEYNRYRVVFPTSHKLFMNADAYKEFMSNIYAWLPFNVDEVTDQRARKWLGYDSNVIYNEGTKLLSVLDFIPDTEQQLNHQKVLKELGDISNLHKWVISEANNPDNGRNNTLIRFALLLQDAGANEEVIRTELLAINAKIMYPLPETEINNTIMVTVMKKAI